MTTGSGNRTHTSQPFIRKRRWNAFVAFCKKRWQFVVVSATIVGLIAGIITMKNEFWPLRQATPRLPHISQCGLDVGAMNDRLNSAIRQSADTAAAVRAQAIDDMFVVADAWQTCPISDAQREQRNAAIGAIVNYLKMAVFNRSEDGTYDPAENNIRITISHKLHDRLTRPPIPKSPEDVEQPPSDNDMPSSTPEERAARARQFCQSGFTASDYAGGPWSDYQFDFSGAKLSEADFSYSVFNQAPNFTGATFIKTADFQNSYIGLAADGSGATFTGAVFEGYANFSSVKFSGGHTPADDVNYYAANFQSADFQSGADFRATVFYGDAGANFGYTQWHGAAYIGSSYYCGALRLYKASVEAETLDMSTAVILKSVDARSLSFTGTGNDATVDMRGCNIAWSVDLSSAVFKNAVYRMNDCVIGDRLILDWSKLTAESASSWNIVTSTDALTQCLQVSIISVDETQFLRGWADFECVKAPTSFDGSASVTADAVVQLAQCYKFDEEHTELVC